VRDRGLFSLGGLAPYNVKILLSIEILLKMKRMPDHWMPDAGLVTLSRILSKRTLFEIVEYSFGSNRFNASMFCESLPSE
jgi:hypothetical protein